MRALKAGLFFVLVTLNVFAFAQEGSTPDALVGPAAPVASELGSASIVPRLGVCDEVDPNAPMLAADLSVFKGCRLDLMSTTDGHSYLWIIDGRIQDTKGSVLSLSLDQLGLFRVKLIVQDVIDERPVATAEGLFTVAVADGFKRLPGQCDDLFFVCWFKWVMANPITAVSYLLNIKEGLCEFGILKC